MTEKQALVWDAAVRLFGTKLNDVEVADAVRYKIRATPEIDLLPQYPEAQVKKLLNDIIYPAGDGLVGKYIVPPFSTLDTRAGSWQLRKDYWVSKLGNIGETEVGLLGGADNTMLGSINDGTSFFDPVLAEIIVRWYAPKGGRVFNPFCGEATVGALAAALGHEFIGIDIRPEQVEKTNAARRLGWTTARPSSAGCIIILSRRGTTGRRLIRFTGWCKAMRTAMSLLLILGHSYEPRARMPRQPAR